MQQYQRQHKKRQAHHVVLADIHYRADRQIYAGPPELNSRLNRPDGLAHSSQFLPFLSGFL